MPLISRLGLLPPVAWMVLRAVLAVVVMVSLASFRLVEQPGIAMGRRLRARLRRRGEGRAAGEAATGSADLSEGARSA